MTPPKVRNPKKLFHVSSPLCKYQQGYRPENFLGNTCHQGPAKKKKKVQRSVEWWTGPMERKKCTSSIFFGCPLHNLLDNPFFLEMYVYYIFRDWFWLDGQK